MTISGIEFNLMISDLYLEIANSFEISQETYKGFKKAVEETDEYIECPEMSTRIIIEASKKILKSRVQELSKKTLVQKFADIVDGINKNLYPIDSHFHKAYFEYQLTVTGNMGIQKQIDMLSKCSNNIETIENVFYKSEYLLTLLRLYIVNPVEYLSEISGVSTKLKEIAPVVDEMLVKLKGSIG